MGRGQEIDPRSWSAVPSIVRRRLREYVFRRAGYRCEVRGAYCTGLAEELDHIVPRFRGGALIDVDNLRASCRACNRGVRWDPRQTAPPSRDW